MSFYWERNPHGPFATLIRVATSYCHPEIGSAHNDPYEDLKRLAGRGDDEEMRLFKAELRAALRDPAGLPGDELGENVEFSDGSDEAFLLRLWRDLYGDEPYVQRGARDQLDELFDRQQEISRQNAAAAAAAAAADPDLTRWVKLTPAFDGRDHVLSRLAYDLHLRAVADSAKARRPGYVPDSHLAGLTASSGGAIEELTAEGFWRRDGDGYTVLDWDLTRVAVEHAHELEDKRLREAAGPVALVAEPACAECGQPSARVELVAPGQMPDQFPRWPVDRQTAFQLGRDFGHWHLVVDDPDGRQWDRALDEDAASTLTTAFRPPLTWTRVRGAQLPGDAGFCEKCGAPYCQRHWRIEDSGIRRCPLGHGQLPISR